MVIQRVPHANNHYCTLKTEYQILRDVISGRAKMQIRHEPPAIRGNQKCNPGLVNVRNPACDFQVKVGSDKYHADVGMVKPKCEDAAL